VTIPQNEILIPTAPRGHLGNVWNDKCCFVCGHPRSEADTNSEHVIPDWVLAEFNLHSSKVSLPNGELITYSRYRLPCHKICNDTLGREIETPVAKIIKQLNHENAGEIVSKYYPLISIWLSLIFLKIHLKDGNLRWHLDSRNRQETISRATNTQPEAILAALLKIRCFLAGIEIAPQAFGTLQWFPVLFKTGSEFDYATFGPAQTIMFRFNNIALINVLDDCCFFSPYLQSYQDRQFAAFVEEQIQEIAIALAVKSDGWRDRPRFFMKRNRRSQAATKLFISPSSFPEPTCFDQQLFIELMAGKFLGKKSDVYSALQKDQFRAGHISFVRDNSGGLVNPKDLSIWHKYKESSLQ
jgi:hypothetical protein